MGWTGCSEQDKMLLSFQFHQRTGSERDPPGEVEKYVPEEEVERGRNPNSQGMFLFVFSQGQSTDIVVPGGAGKKGMIVYLQDDREELCLLTYTASLVVILLQSLQGPISSSSGASSCCTFHFENRSAGKGGIILCKDRTRVPGGGIIVPDIREVGKCKPRQCWNTPSSNKRYTTTTRDDRYRSW